MDAGPGHATSPWSKQLAELLSEKEFRDEYMMDQVRTNIAFQIRAMREQPCRGWTQAELAERAQTTQSVISRLENPDYGSMTLQTLFEAARAFDVALLVQFVEWEDWLERMTDVSPAALEKRSFNEERLIRLAELSSQARVERERETAEALAPLAQSATRWLGSVGSERSTRNLAKLYPSEVTRPHAQPALSSTRPQRAAPTLLGF